MTVLKRISRDIFWKSSSNFLFILFSLLISVFLNRHYGKELYGLLVLVYTVTSFCFLFSDLGAKQTINRFIPQYLKLENEEGTKHLIKSAFLFQVAGAVLFAIILLLSSDLIATAFFHRPELAPLIKFGILFFVTLSLMDFIFQIFQALQWWLKESMLNILYLISYLGLIYLFTFLLSLSIKNVIIANIIACILIICLSIFLLPKDIRSFFSLNLNFSQVKIMSKNIFTFGFPLLFNNITFFILMWFDKALLGKYRHITDVTFYYIAFSLYSGIMIIIKTLYTVFMPYIASISIKSTEHIQYNFKLISKWFIQISIFLSILSFFAIEPLVKLLYGMDYLPVVTAFRLLIMLIILRAMTNPIHMFMLNVYALVKENLIISSVLAASTAILDILLIPFYGYKGAVISAATGYILFTAGSLFVAKIRHMIPIRTIINTAGCLTTLIAIFYLFNSLGFKNSFLLGPMLLSFYFVLLIIAKELKTEDLIMLKKIIGIY